MNIHLYFFVNPSKTFTLRTRDEKKERLISEKAVEIVVNEGFDGLSMQKLAKAANVSPATIYIYFRDREDLIRKISIAEEMKMFKATLQGFDPDMSFSEGLKHQWRNRAKYFLQHPLQMHFMEQIRYSRFHEEVRKCGKEEFIAKMRQFVQNAVERGELIRLPLEVYWSVAFAPLYQLVKFHINKKGMLDRPFLLDEKTLELSLSLVLKALKP